MPEEIQKFSTKVDWWIVVIIVLALALAPLLVGIQAWQTGEWAAFWFVIVAEILTISVLLLFTIPVRYDLGREELKVRSGVITYTVPLDKIKSVTETRNPLSAPAWSLDRLRIEYDNQGYPAWILISPRNREQFTAELEAQRKVRG